MQLYFQQHRLMMMCVWVDCGTGWWWGVFELTVALVDNKVCLSRLWHWLMFHMDLCWQRRWWMLMCICVDSGIMFPVERGTWVYVQPRRGDLFSRHWLMLMCTYVDSGTGWCVFVSIVALVDVDDDMYLCGQLCWLVDVNMSALSSSPFHCALHSERGEKTRRTNKEVGRQHQGMDRPGVQQVPESSGEQGKMEKTCCRIICGAPSTLAVMGLMMMYMGQTFCVPMLFLTDLNCWLISHL